MKSSTILKQVLDIFLHKYDPDMPGICDNLIKVSYRICGLYRRELFDNGFKYIEKYKPSSYGLYWWPTDDVQTRIDVLNKAIADALANDD